MIIDMSMPDSTNHNVTDISDRLTANTSDETAKLEQFANTYLEDIRHAYNAREIHYTGRRNEEQSLIAGLLGDEADLYFDGATTTLFSLSEDGLGFTGNIIEPVRLEPVLQHALNGDGFEKLQEMKSAFRQVVVAIGIASLRMERDQTPTISGSQMVSMFELDHPKQLAVLNAIFSDFQELNTLRFGAKGSGLMRTLQLDPFAEDTKYQVDRDVIPKRQQREHLLDTPYREIHHQSEIPAVHVSGKMSPAEYRKLRQQFRDIDKSLFDKIVGFHQGARKYLEEQFSH